MKKRVVLLALIFVFCIANFFNSSLIIAQSQSSEVIFYTGGMHCEKNYTSSSWYNSSSLIREIVGPSGNCSNHSSLPNLPSCCPYDQTCNFETGKCYTANIYRCDQYADSSSCNADDLNVGNQSVHDPSSCVISPTFKIGSESCVNVTLCNCKWNSSLNSCLAVASSSVECNGINGGSSGRCEFGVSVLQDNCNNSLNNILITSVAHWIPGTIYNSVAQANCTNWNRSYPCISTARLDFVTNISLIFIILIIILIYYFLSKRIFSKVNSKNSR